MICKSVVQVLGIEPAEFPKPRQGERPFDELTYWDRDSREKNAVTLLIDRQVPQDCYPADGERITAVMQIEQVARVVKRQDREDPGRTYDSAAKQFKVKVIAFEPAPQAAQNGTGDPGKAKAAAKAA